MNRDVTIKRLLIVLYAAVITAACSIPFYFESPSIFYKTGLDKILLRSGKILGITTVVMMVVQLICIGRFGWIDHVFGIKKLIAFHRTSGLILLGAATLHPVLVLGADHFVLFPFETRYWAEFTGIILLVILIFFVLTALWQKKLKIAYQTWRNLHKIVAPVLFVLMAVHVVNVSRTFESGVPFYAVATIVITAFLFFVRKYLTS